MELDPQDGKIAFFEAEAGFEVETPEDVEMVLRGLHKAAKRFKAEYGHIGYPIFMLNQHES